MAIEMASLFALHSRKLFARNLGLFPVKINLSSFQNKINECAQGDNSIKNAPKSRKVHLKNKPAYWQQFIVMIIKEKCNSFLGIAQWSTRRISN